MSLCYNCFKEYFQGSTCPFCGYDDNHDKGEFPYALAHGTVLGGKYISGRVLGQGGFGITYVAQDYMDKKLVAIKEYFPEAMATRSGGKSVSTYSGDRAEGFRYGKECFLSEAKTLAEFIGNPNIVRVYSYFEENNTAYFAMEYIEGITLINYVKNHGGKISYEETKNLLLPMMDALSVVHSKGIIHRDISPDNIYITKDGTVKLIDFGAARYSLGDRSRSLDVVLKHGYAPMEQYTRRGRQGPYTDVYSLAATFYRCITGRIPPDSVDRISEDSLVPPSRLGVNIPVHAEEALLKALEVMTADRFSNMKQFKEALIGDGSAAAPAAPAPRTYNIPPQYPWSAPAPAPSAVQQNPAYAQPQSTYDYAQPQQPKKPKQPKNKKPAEDYWNDSPSQQPAAPAPSERSVAPDYSAAPTAPAAYSEPKTAPVSRPVTTEESKTASAPRPVTVNQPAAAPAPRPVTVTEPKTAPAYSAPAAPAREPISSTEPRTMPISSAVPAPGPAPVIAPSPADDQQKKKKKKTIILISSIAAVLVILGVAAALIIPNLPGVKYASANSALESGDYQKALDGFTALGDYEDSSKKAVEATYGLASQLADQGDYSGALNLLASLPQNDTTKSKTNDINYRYAKAYIDQGDYSSAIYLLDSLNGYKDSDTLLKECHYNKGKQYYDAKQYKEAVDSLLECIGFKDANDLCFDAMYQYVLAHKSSDDETTRTYLTALKQASYKDSDKIFATLFSWSVKPVYFNDSSSDTSTVKTSVSKTSSYLHAGFEITDGSDGETVTLYNVAVWPDGSEHPASWSWEDKEVGDFCGVEWANGINMDAGTLTIIIYNRENDMELCRTSITLK